MDSVTVEVGLRMVWSQLLLEDRCQLVLASDPGTHFLNTSVPCFLVQQQRDKKVIQGIVTHKPLWHVSQEMFVILYQL